MSAPTKDTTMCQCTSSGASLPAEELKTTFQRFRDSLVSQWLIIAQDFCLVSSFLVFLAVVEWIKLRVELDRFAYVVIWIFSLEVILLLSMNVLRETTLLLLSFYRDIVISFRKPISHDKGNEPQEGAGLSMKSGQAAGEGNAQTEVITAPQELSVAVPPATDPYEKAGQGSVTGVKELREPGNGSIAVATELPAGRPSSFQIDNDQRIEFLKSQNASQCFTRTLVEMVPAFDQLARVHSCFYAVSRDELVHWLRPDEWDKKYYSSNCDMVLKGKAVTRVFVLSGYQLDVQMLVEVLMNHMKDGISVAVVPYDQLPQILQESPSDLDFALWDSDKASSVFRHEEGGIERKMSVSLSEAAGKHNTERRWQTYGEIFSRIWLADSVFIAAHKSLIGTHKESLDRNKTRLIRRSGFTLASGGTFFIEVSSERELREKVEKLVASWRLMTQSEGFSNEEAARIDRDW